MKKKSEAPQRLMRVHVTLPEDLMERVKEAAIRDDQTLTRKMIRLIERGLSA